MIYMPAEDKGKKRKLALPYHGPCRIKPNTLVVRPVDRVDMEPIRVSMDRVIRCSEELPDESWLGPREKKRRRRKKSKKTAPSAETTPPDVGGPGPTRHRYSLRTK